jgi:hypothetical protein
MKRLTLRKNRSNEAMKRLALLKNWSDEAFNASSPHFIASSLHCCQHYINPYRNRQINRAKHFKTYGKAKTTMFFGLATEITEITNFFWKLPFEFIASSLLSVNIFFVKALRQWRQIREAMKRWNVKYGKKFEQWSDEAFNAGNKTEAMKRLTLHRIALSLHRFIASSAQLWSLRAFSSSYRLKHSNCQSFL